MNQSYQGWITGWKKIAQYIDRSSKTAKLYYKKYGMPVRRLPGNMPGIIPSEVDEWWINFDEIKKTTKG